MSAPTRFASSSPRVIRSSWKFWFAILNIRVISRDEFKRISKAPRLDCLSDYLPWTALIAPGTVLNKDGSFQRSAEFRGPDLESSTEEELVATCARLNNALRRFGSGWALYFEAARIPARKYPVSEFSDPAAWIVEQERRGEFEEEFSKRDLFESVYYLTHIGLLISLDDALLTALQGRSLKGHYKDAAAMVRQAEVCCRAAQRSLDE